MELARIRTTIDAPAERVWAILTDFRHPQVLARTIESCEADGDGVGAIRIVRARGLSIHERLVEVEPSGFRFVYEALPAGDMPAANLKSYWATVVLRPLGSARTEVEWRGEGEIDGQTEATMAAFADLYARAIENLQHAARFR